MQIEKDVERVIGMKKYFAVFELGTGRSLIKILLGAVIMIAAESILFFVISDQGQTDFGWVLQHCHIDLVFIACSVFFTIAAVTTWKPRMRNDYNYDRLAMSKGKAFVMTSLAGAVVWLFYWLLQVIIVYCFYRYYMANFGRWSGLEIFALFHDYPFLIDLFPMDRAGRWVMLLIRALCVGTGAATFEYRELRGAGIIPIIMVALSVLHDGYGPDHPLTVLYLGVISAFAILVIGAFAIKKAGDEDEQKGDDQK